MQLLSSEYFRFVVIYLSAMIRLRNFIYFVGKLESEQSLHDRLRQGRQNVLPDYWQPYHLRWLSHHLLLTILPQTTWPRDLWQSDGWPPF